ncbi:MAG: VOC family protein [Kiloniellales bacterium]
MKMVAPLEVGICCQNLDRLLAFYTGTLGCELVSDVEVPPAKAQQAALSGSGYRVVRIQTPWGERLKLLQPKSPPDSSAPTRWILDRRNAAYFTFIVDDLQAMIDRLKEAGVELLTGDEGIEVRPATYLAFARDPEGNVLEFVEYGDIATYRPDLAAKRS